MTEPIDSQEMLAEYGAIKSADNAVLEHFIAFAKRQQKIYKSDLERINHFGFEKAMKMILYSDTKEDLIEANLPVTERTVVAHIETYIKNNKENIEMAKEERR
tara:strand:+ start:659 stop:967 length:309 start_codon:yes stop_codon:yes gene_type:complete